MDKYELISQNIQTVLLGFNKRSRRLARQIYREYGIRSYICDSSLPPVSLSASYALWKIPPAQCNSLVSDALLHLASYDRLCIYVATPINDLYKGYVKECAEQIEHTYIVSDDKSVFAKLPIINSNTENNGG